MDCGGRGLKQNKMISDVEN